MSVPEMTDLYRRLLNELTERFGGTIDDANADAIAYAAAELYHRDFEPRLWQERSAHDLLDLFGVPRAGVFAPFALSDRLVLFQKRSSQAQYVARAHELLTQLGVPRQDASGTEQPLKWRLEQLLTSVTNTTPEAPSDEAPSDEAPSDEAPSDEAPSDEAPSDEAPSDEAPSDEAPSDEAPSDEAPSDEAPSEEPGEADSQDEPSPDTEAAESNDGLQQAPAVGDLGLVDNTLPDATEPHEIDTASEAKVEVESPAPATDAARPDPDPTTTDDDDGKAGEPASDEDAGSPAMAGETGGEPAEVSVGTADGSSNGRGDSTGSADVAGTKPESDDARTASVDDEVALAEAVANALSDGDGSQSPSSGEPSAAQIVDAVKALEQAAEVEASLAGSPDGAGAVDLVRLTETLNGIQSEIAALRELVEAFEIGLRRQLDELQTQMTVATQTNGGAPAAGPLRTQRSGPDFQHPPEQGGISVPRGSHDPTGPLSPIDSDALAAGTHDDAEPVKEHPTLRRVLLVVLLLLLGVALAGGIALAAAWGWDSLRSQSNAFFLPLI